MYLAYPYPPNTQLDLTFNMTTFPFDIYEALAHGRPRDRAVDASLLSWLEWDVSRSSTRASQPPGNARQRLTYSLYRQLELATWNTEVAIARGDLEEAQDEDDLAEVTMVLMNVVVDRSSAPDMAESACRVRERKA